MDRGAWRDTAWGRKELDMTDTKQQQQYKSSTKILTLMKEIREDLS